MTLRIQFAKRFEEIHHLNVRQEQNDLEGSGSEWVRVSQSGSEHSLVLPLSIQ